MNDAEHNETPRRDNNSQITEPKPDGTSGDGVTTPPQPTTTSPDDGGLRIEELKLLMEHADRMWNAEEESRRRLSLRGRVVVASTSGLLGFIAIGLIVAGSDSKLNLVTDADLQRWFTIFTVIGTGGIAIGLLACIRAVITYVAHTEEDSGVHRVQTDFNAISANYHDIRPDLYTVCPSYAFLTALHAEKGYLLGYFFHARVFFAGFVTGIRIRYRWSIKRGGSHLKSAPYFLIYTCFQLASFLLPGTRCSRFLRHSIDRSYLNWVIRYMNRANDKRFFVREQLRDIQHAEVKAKSTSKVKKTDRPIKMPYLEEDVDSTKPQHMRVLAHAPSYFLQFDRSFTAENLGRPNTPKQKSESFEFDPDSVPVEGVPLRNVTWRAFISTYFAAQHLRACNWNLWFRVRKTERLFAFGLSVVAFSFIITAGTGEFIQKFSTPVPPMRIDLQDGKLFLEHNPSGNPTSQRQPEPSQPPTESP